MTQFRIALLGPPGVGKGTQASRLSEAFAIPHIATGDMFRAALGARTPIGLAAKPFMDKGELVPDDVTIGIVEERLLATDAALGFVMDGFPRTVRQATGLDALLAKLRMRLNAVVEIAVPREELIRRLTTRLVCEACQEAYRADDGAAKARGSCERCGGKLVHRVDDNPQTVARRLDVYERQTRPLSEYYRGSGLLVTVDGMPSIDAVFAAILAATGNASTVGPLR